MTEAFTQTQKKWMTSHPDATEAEWEKAIDRFTEALATFGRDEKWVQTALEDAGFDYPTPGSRDMALLSYAGKQAAMMQERGTKYSIQTLPDGTQYVLVDTDQHIFDGVEEKEYKNIAKEYIKKHFSGNLYGKNGSIKVTTRSAKEYTYPANRRIKSEIKSANMKAATEVDNLIKVSEYLGHENDNGRHPPAAKGWDNYKVIYKVDGKFFEGITRIMLTEDQPLFYDIAKTKEIDIARRSRTESHNAIGREHGNASANRVAEKGEKVNQKFSLKQSPTEPVEEGLQEDAELYAQIKASDEGKAALKILQKLYGMATRGDSYLMEGEKEALIEKGAWQKRMPEIMEKIKTETGSEINERKLRSDLAAIFNAMDRGEDVSDMLLAAKDLGRDILAEAPGMINPGKQKTRNFSVFFPYCRWNTGLSASVSRMRFSARPITSFW